jgi:8-oxo-dGTP diphosphatase
MIKVAAGIIRRNGRILLCQRKREGRYGLKWEFPGGKVEAEESFEQCLKRELYEELSIDTGEVELFEEQRTFYQDGGWFHIAFYSVLTFHGEPKNNVFENIQWLTLEEMKPMDILEGNRPVVDSLIKRSQ